MGDERTLSDDEVLTVRSAESPSRAQVGDTDQDDVDVDTDDADVDVDADDPS